MAYNRFGQNRNDRSSRYLPDEDQISYRDRRYQSEQDYRNNDSDMSDFNRDYYNRDINRNMSNYGGDYRHDYYSPAFSGRDERNQDYDYRPSQSYGSFQRENNNRYGQSRNFDFGSNQHPYSGYEPSYDRYESSADQNYQRYSGTGGYGSTTNYSGRGPKGWSRSDDRIKEDVSETLERDPHVDASEIEVKVEGGIVTLSGSVEDRRSKRHAEDIIENLMGVKDVRNELSIDQSLFQQVKEAIMGESGESKGRSKSGRTATTGTRH